MKKKFLLPLFSLCALLGAVGFAACNKDGEQSDGSSTTPTPAHVHAFETLHTDETHHWLSCSCGEFQEKIPHEYNSPWTLDASNHSKSCVCGAKQEGAHQFDDGGVCTTCHATHGTEGLKYTLSADETYYVCTGIGAATETDIVIADIHEGLLVKEIEEDAFVFDDITSVTIGDAVTSIGESAFIFCRSLNAVTIGDGVTSIGTSAFGSCNNLTSVSIGSGVTSIGTSAFGGCSSLLSFTVGNSVTSIGTSAFSFCSSLSSFAIGDNVASIGETVFIYCENLKDITVSENNAHYKSIDGNLYTKDGKMLMQYAVGKEATEFTVPDGVTSIAKSAFQNNATLTNITLPDTLTSLKNSALNGCSQLTTITVGENNAQYKSVDGNLYTKDGKRLVQYANGKTATEFTVPDFVNTIGYCAFDNSVNLISITIPNSVTVIETAAFQYCDNLTGVYVDDMTAWCSITFESGMSNPLYYAKNLYLNDQLVTDVVIPESCTSMKGYTFYSCTSIQSVTFPDGLLSIGESTFDGCENLTELILPDSVETIGRSAFSDCENLTEVVIPDSVTTLGDYAFVSCGQLASVTLGSSVGSIGAYAFENCKNLKTIILPKSVTSIGGYSFNLHQIYYEGTASEWAEIERASDDYVLNSTAIYYYSETQPEESGDYWHYDTDGITPVEW